MLRRDGEVFRFGTAMAGSVRLGVSKMSGGLGSNPARNTSRRCPGDPNVAGARIARVKPQGRSGMGANTQIVQEIYAAFGEGRVGDIVARIADDADFIHSGGEAIPWSGNYKGPARVAQFFAD